MEFTQPVSSLAERFELGSKAWVAEARRYLEREVASRGGFEDLDLSIGSLWTDPPPHLGFGDRPAGWSARFAAGRVTVESGPPDLDSLDAYTRGDYNAAVPIATIVYGDEPAIAARAERESQHRSGSRHPRVHGSLPPSAEVGELLHDFHDHLARRTIDNLDIDHRIHHLGLEKNAAEIAERGYTVLERAITDELADEMTAEIDRLHEEQASAGFRANMLLGRGRLFEEAVQHPFVFALAERLAGRGCLMYQSNCIRKAPGFDPHQLHCDHIAMSEPFPDWPIGITSMWALEDWTPDVGPTLFAPGTFREHRHPRPGETRPLEPLLMPKGSIAVWNGATWHSSSPRTKEGLRRSLHNVYTRMQFRSMDDYRAIDPAIVDRNAPRFSTICGLDDFFGRNTDTGPESEVMQAVFAAGYGSSPLPPSAEKPFRL